MSTKVYVAYRIKDPSKLWEVVAYLQKEGEAAVSTRLRKIYGRMIEGLDESNEEFTKTLADWPGDLPRAKLHYVHKALREFYKSQLNNPHKNEFDFTASVSFHEEAGQIYLIPYAGLGVSKVLQFMSKSPLLEDFAYWNNSDAPEGMSEEEWTARGKVWDAICDKGWDKQLILEISTWSNYYELDPYFELRRALPRITPK